MKKIKLSDAEKRLIRFLIISIFVQIILIRAFVFAINGLHPIEIYDTKCVDIVVEHMQYMSGKSGSKLIVYSGTNEYEFRNNSTGDDPSVRELSNMIAVGDKISLNYCESKYIWGEKFNEIVNAQTDAETYRSIDNVNESRKTGATIFLVVLVVCELNFALVVTIRIISAQKSHTIRMLIRKIKKKR